MEDNRVSVDVTITMDYGSPIPDVARNIQENVKKAIETMSGLDVRNVDVHVTGISFEREQRANAELDEQHRKMLEKTAETSAEEKAEEPAVEAAVEEAASEVEEEIEDEEPEEEEEEPEEEPEIMEIEPVIDDEDDDEIEEVPEEESEKAE